MGPAGHRARCDLVLLGAAPAPRRTPSAAGVVSYGPLGSLLTWSRPSPLFSCKVYLLLDEPFNLLVPLPLFLSGESAAGVVGLAELEDNVLCGGL